MADFLAQHPLLPVWPGTVEERARARLAAARLVVRNGGTPADLWIILSALALWPQQDHP